MEDLTPFQKKLRERLAERAAAEAPKLPDTLADLGKEDRRQRDQVDIDIDRVLDIGIEDAYRKWCPKMEPVLTGKRESIMVSCPKPNHADAHPSAWLNLDKRTWFCGGCQEGGDGYDIAAYHFGYAVPGYKTDGSFPKLRRDMAESLGYKVRRSSGGVESLVEKIPESQEPTAQVLELVSDDDDDDDDDELLAVGLPIDWRSLLPKGTFLEQWMQVTSADYLPEEYYFWLGLLAVGFAAGRQVGIPDGISPVRPNLFICLLGKTASGKSRSEAALKMLLEKAFPYDDDDPNSTGTFILPLPGSPEALVDQFEKKIIDPNDPKTIMGYAGVRGLIGVNELSSLMAKIAKLGSTMSGQLIQFYDCGDSPIELVSRSWGKVRAEEFFASALTTTQLKSIRNVFVQRDADSGFANRWFYASGPRKERKSAFQKPLVIDSLVDPLNALRQWTSLRYREVSFSPDADALFFAFVKEVLDPLTADDNEDDDPLLGRSELLIKKLLLLFAVNEKKDVIDKNMVERVLALWPHIKYGYQMLISEIGVGIGRDCRNRILVSLRRFEKRMKRAATKGEMVKGLGKHNFEPEMIARTIKAMVDLGDIVEQERKGVRGPGTEVYRCA